MAFSTSTNDTSLTTGRKKLEVIKAMEVVIGDPEQDLKIRRMFRHFDGNKDGFLSKRELSDFVTAVNPLVNFTQDQVNQLIERIFITYSQFVNPVKGLSLDGLRRTYQDGAGDVDKDFYALGLPDEEEEQEEEYDGDFQPPDYSNQGQEIQFKSTETLIEDLQIELKRREKTDAKGNKEIVQSSDLSNAIQKLRCRADDEPPEAAFEGHLEMGRLLLKREIVQEAILSFHQAMSFNSNDCTAHFLCGTAYFGLGQLDEAQDEFESALSLGKADPITNSSLLPKVG